MDSSSDSDPPPEREPDSNGPGGDPNSPIPDSWPPVNEQQTQTVPMFPLRGVQLFPGSIMPLNIFEPRYRAMVEDLLDSAGRLVLATAMEEDKDEMAGAPRVHPVAGLGEIGKHVRLPDGRFLIWLIGLGRVRLQEVESDKLYRRVEAEPLEEVAVPSGMRSSLESKLKEAIRERWDGELQLPENLPAEFLTDLLLQKLDLDSEEMLELFSEPVVIRRAEGALALHETRPFVQEDDDDEA